MNTASKMTTGDREGAAPQQPIDAYRESVLPFQVASASKATWQLINSAGPYLLLWTAMVYALQVSYWLMLPLAVVAAGFLVRIFIIFHDCGHGSFLPSRRANQIVGGLTGLVNLTPYQHWRWQHALHRGTSGNLDRRGAGDVWTLTVQEYLHSNPWKRAAYRVVRHPLVLFAVAPCMCLSCISASLRHVLRRVNAGRYDGRTGRCCVRGCSSAGSSAGRTSS
jgi:acyl-lipid omega-6 desaturase (Delta-12 desaturase)